MTINLSKGDENPSVAATLKKVDGTKTDIPQNATVYFVVNKADGTVLVDREVDTYDDRNNGEVTFDWKSSETDDIPAGVHKAVFIIEDANGDETTFPNVGALPLKVDDDSDLNRGSP